MPNNRRGGLIRAVAALNAGREIYNSLACRSSLVRRSGEMTNINAQRRSSG